jgi:4-hydroxy-3-polyprenylbenzoate decarboxylase
MPMQHKIVIAITGASGSIYAKVLLDKLAALNTQIAQVGIVMSKNAKEVWETELGNTDFNNYPFNYYEKFDFNAPFCLWIGGLQHYDCCTLQYGHPGPYCSWY